MLDPASNQAKDFVVFKRELYQMYVVQSRSVHEHELFSFKIERDELKYLYQANINFIEEMQRQNKLQQAIHYSSLNGAVFRRKLLNPKRIKGVGSFAATWYIYSNLPYLAVYLGSTLPVLAACAAAFNGMISFAES